MNTIGDIAMDLKRAALGSEKVSGVFLGEAVERKKGVNREVPSYIRNILDSLGKNEDKENLLMYSTLLQNYSLKYGK